MIFERFKNGIHQMTSMEPSAVYNLTMNKVHKVGGEADVEVQNTWSPFLTGLSETIKTRRAETKPLYDVASATYNVAVNKTHITGGEADVVVVKRWQEDYPHIYGWKTPQRWDFNDPTFIPPSDGCKESTSQSSQCSPST